MKKILVVEDNIMIQEILTERLRLRNFEVITVDNGQESVNRAAQEQPDIILMDISLPFVDGWNATRQLKAAASTRHIPVIALTAHASPDDRDKSLDAGCDDFETKPVNFAQLLSKIESLTREK